MSVESNSAYIRLMLLGDATRRLKRGANLDDPFYVAMLSSLEAERVVVLADLKELMAAEINASLAMKGEG